MGLRVIGAGLPRTGTLSLKLALEQLGFGPCHHMVEMFANQQQLDAWCDVYDGKEPEWDDVLGDYRSCVDVPGMHFYRELAARYPEAKVILSTRSPESWVKSAWGTLVTEKSSNDFGHGPFTPFLNRMVARWQVNQPELFRGDFEGSIAAFQRHEAQVRAAIPAERLLVHSARDGWGPLCEFLGVPVPADPYPRTNSTQEWLDEAAKITTEAE